MLPVNENEIAARLAAIKFDPPPPAEETEGPGLVGEIPPLRILLLPDEAFYVRRLVAADVQRMTENRDHGVSHGMRGYAPPNLEVGLNVLHSLDMAHTSAAIEAIEALEEQREDAAALEEIKRQEQDGAEAAKYFAGEPNALNPGGSE